MERLISKVLDLRFLEVKDLFYRLSPGKYRTQTYTVPHEVKTLLIFGLADHYKKLREAFEEFGVISAIMSFV